MVDLLADAGRFDEAITVCNQAIKLDPASRYSAQEFNGAGVEIITRVDDFHLTVMHQLFDDLAFGTDPAGRAPGVFADSVVDKIARLAPNRFHKSGTEESNPLSV